MKKRTAFFTDNARKFFIFLTIAIIATVGAVTAINVFKSDDLESAINEYEDQDYLDAIVELNRLSQVSDYERSEKIYYYRCRSLNGLALKLEKKFEDELTSASLEKKGTADFNNSSKKISEKLSDINKKTGGDLALVYSRKKSRIASRGRFYEEFISKYKGSGLIEDLDFEEVQKTERTEPEKLLSSIVNFYTRYPNTNYIAQLARMIFDGLQKENLNVVDKKDQVWNIIISYVGRYPTSPETGKLYISDANNVNMRNSPGTDGKLVGKIARDEILIQLEKSMDTTQIGDRRDYWYRVSTLGGLKGWIFGKFLKPLDISKYKTEEAADKWTIEETFDEWEDSNTPKNWAHIQGSDRSAIGFASRSGKKTAVINSSRAGSAGLFVRHGTTRSFTISSRARLTGGGSLVILAYGMGNGLSFYVKLMPQTVESSGRTVPVKTGEWHTYTLKSEDGRFASLYIDGEMITTRIEASVIQELKQRGVYCLYSPKNEESTGEIEYIKIK
ncbi:MAG: SH3 domain-containing protein [Spirochaetes bacterium]|nr:SH3 domain-containing protein [Spirochaetota bacterium]